METPDSTQPPSRARRALRLASLKFKVRGRLLAAFGAVIAGQLAATAVALHSANQLDGLFAKVAEQQAESVASFEMEINSLEAGAALFKLLQSGDTKHIERYHENVREFWQFHAEYRANSHPGEESAWADQIETLFREYATVAEQLIGIEESRSAVTAELSTFAAELEALVDHSPAARASLDGDVIKTILRLQGEVSEMFVWLLSTNDTDTQNAALAKLTEVLEEIETNQKRLARMALPTEWRGWAKRFNDVISEVAPRARQLGAYRVETAQKVEKFIALRQRLDDILDEGIQLRSAEDLAAAKKEKADAIYAGSNLILGLGLVSIALAILAIKLLSNTIVRPLAVLSRAAGRISAGELGARAPVAGKDEIAALGTAFNDMAAAVQRNQTALQTANQDLESKVAERTREIEDANKRLLRELEGRARVEEELREAMSTAQAANRAKSGFLANMSHELRTPLNAVIGFSEVISQELHGKVDNPRYLEYSQYIHQSGTHLLRLINDILDLSRIEAGRIDLSEEAVDVAAVIDEVANLLKQQAANASLEVELAVADGLPRLYADGGRLRQILVNLVANAIKFTKPGGRITVRAGVGSGAEKRFEIAVADTGIGIPEDQIEVALSSFGRVENGMLREGTGLGLPLTKKLAELHGGGLVLESKVDVGTTVTAWFPADRIRESDKGERAKAKQLANA
jgi:signal transduction histidine kinase